MVKIMGDSTEKRISRILLFLILVLFPFGQLIRISAVIVGNAVTLQPLDFFVFAFALIAIIKRYRLPEKLKPLRYLILVIFASFVFSFLNFSFSQLLTGAFYLLRIFAYFGFFVAFINYLKKDEAIKKQIFDIMIIESIFIGIFGWLQYFIYPDVRFLYFLGWDDHLFRMIGTFLDPAFTGALLVFGCIIALEKYFSQKRSGYLLASVFLFISVAFTYSRASVLALLFGIFALYYLRNKLKYFILTSVVILLVMSLLPKPAGEGVNLVRVSSISARLINYQQSLTVIKNYPIMGVGFNNVCESKVKIFGIGDLSSHACSGFDSSLMFYITTTGIIGLGVLLYVLFSIVKDGMKINFATISVFSAATVHSFFSNTLFYPWVMFYLIVVFSGGFKDSKKV